MNNLPSFSPFLLSSHLSPFLLFLKKLYTFSSLFSPPSPLPCRLSSSIFSYPFSLSPYAPSPRSSTWHFFELERYSQNTAKCPGPGEELVITTATASRQPGTAALFS